MKQKQPLPEPDWNCRVARFGHVNAERLDQPAVLNSGGTGRLAGPAIQTQVQMAANLGAQLEPAIGHGSH
jgi:uncharacterized protein YbjT (DUF2867 family)